MPRESEEQRLRRVLNDSRTVASLGQRVVDYIGKNPILAGQLGNAISKGARAIGVGVGSGLALFGAVQKVVRSRSEIAQATGQSIDTARALGFDQSISRRVRTQAIERARGQTFLSPHQTGIRTVLDAVAKIPGGGFARETLEEALGSTAQKEGNKRAQEELRIRSEARGAIEFLGEDMMTALGNFAKEKGVSPSLLTEGELREFPDATVDRAVRQLESSEGASAYEESEMAKMSGADKARLSASGGTEAKRAELRRDFALKKLKTATKEEQDAAKRHEAYLQSLTPKERFERDEGTRQFRASFTAINSRHRVVELD